MTPTEAGREIVLPNHKSGQQPAVLYMGTDTSALNHGLVKNKERVDLTTLATKEQQQEKGLVTWLAQQTETAPKVIPAASEQAMQPAPRGHWTSDILAILPGVKTLPEVEQEAPNLFQARAVTKNFFFFFFFFFLDARLN